MTRNITNNPLSAKCAKPSDTKNQIGICKQTRSVLIDQAFGTNWGHTWLVQDGHGFSQCFTSLIESQPHHVVVQYNILECPSYSWPRLQPTHCATSDGILCIEEGYF